MTERDAAAPGWSLPGRDADCAQALEFDLALLIRGCQNRGAFAAVHEQTEAAGRAGLSDDLGTRLLRGKNRRILRRPPRPQAARLRSEPA